MEPPQKLPQASMLPPGVSDTPRSGVCCVASLALESPQVKTLSRLVAFLLPSRAPGNELAPWYGARGSRDERPPQSTGRKEARSGNDPTEPRSDNAPQEAPRSSGGRQAPRALLAATLGRAVRAARMRAGLTQVELTESIGTATEVYG